MSAARLGFLLLAFSMGPCMAQAEDAARRTFIYTAGHFAASQLLGGEAECADARSLSETASGRFIEVKKGHYYFEGYNCTLEVGSNLDVRCGGGEIGDKSVPALVVQSFAFDEKSMDVAGVMEMDGQSYCYSISATDLAAAD